jgi:hypothetical protein
MCSFSTSNYHDTTNTQKFKYINCFHLIALARQHIITTFNSKLEVSIWLTAEQWYWYKQAWQRGQMKWEWSSRNQTMEQQRFWDTNETPVLLGYLSGALLEHGQSLTVLLSPLHINTLVVDRRATIPYGISSTSDSQPCSHLYSLGVLTARCPWGYLHYYCPFHHTDASSMTVMTRFGPDMRRQVLLVRNGGSSRGPRCASWWVPVPTAGSPSSTFTSVDVSSVGRVFCLQNIDKIIQFVKVQKNTRHLVFKPLCF